MHLLWLVLLGEDGGVGGGSDWKVGIPGWYCQWFWFSEGEGGKGGLVSLTPVYN